MQDFQVYDIYIYIYTCILNNLYIDMYNYILYICAISIYIYSDVLVFMFLFNIRVKRLPIARIYN